MAVPEDDRLVGILNRIQGWSVAADQKTGVIVAIQTLACGFLFPEVRDWFKSPHTSVGINIALLAAGCLLGAGIANALRALFPNIQGPELRSVTFFGSIQMWSLEGFRQRLENMDGCGGWATTQRRFTEQRKSRRGSFN